MNFADDYFIRDSKVLSFFNQKSGTTKTSSVAIIGYILAKEYNKRVLIIDCDPMANLTMRFNMLKSENANEYNLYQAFSKQESIKEHIRNTGYENLDIVISHYDVERIASLLPTMTFKEQRFAAIIEEVKTSGYYDFILCDCAPTLSMFNNIILRATDGVIIPVIPNVFNIVGLSNVIDYLNVIIEENKISPIKKKTSILGIYLNRYEESSKVSIKILEDLKKSYASDKYLFDTYISMDDSMIKSQREKKSPSINYSSKNVYEGFKLLTEEIMERAKTISPN